MTHLSEQQFHDIKTEIGKNFTYFLKIHLDRFCKNYPDIRHADYEVVFNSLECVNETIMSDLTRDICNKVNKQNERGESV